MHKRLAEIESGEMQHTVRYKALICIPTCSLLHVYDRLIALPTADGLLAVF